jgi:hypothetical protein
MNSFSSDLPCKDRNVGANEQVLGKSASVKRGTKHDSDEGPVYFQAGGVSDASDDEPEIVMDDAHVAGAASETSRQAQPEWPAAAKGDRVVPLR